MAGERPKNPRRNIRDSGDFKRFRKAMTEGFVVKENGENITNQVLLDCSQALAKILSKGSGFRQRTDTVNQFRKFFNEVCGLKGMNDNSSKLGVELLLLRARMGYASGRRIISEDFRIVITECIDTLLAFSDVSDQMAGFCDFFEALYAYYYYHANSR